jgi:hypothetical protein
VYQPVGGFLPTEFKLVDPTGKRRSGAYPLTVLRVDIIQWLGIRRLCHVKSVSEHLPPVNGLWVDICSVKPGMGVFNSLIIHSANGIFYPNFMHEEIKPSVPFTGFF